MRGYWSRICAVCLLSVPCGFAWKVFTQRILVQTERPESLAIMNNPARMLEIHKRLEQQHLWLYILLCAVLPSIYVSLVELVAYLIRRTFNLWQDASEPATPNPVI